MPALEARLEAWRFLRQLADRAPPVENAAALLSAACEEVRQSNVLQEVLKASLRAGERGGAHCDACSGACFGVWGGL